MLLFSRQKAWFITWTNRKTLMHSHRRTTIICKLCRQPSHPKHLKSIWHPAPHLVSVFSFSQPDSIFSNFLLHPSLSLFPSVVHHQALVCIPFCSVSSIWLSLLIYPAAIQIKGKMTQKGVEESQTGHMEELQWWTAVKEFSWLNVPIYLYL